MDHRRRGDAASDGEDSRRKKRHSRSASPGAARSRYYPGRDRRRPPLHGRGRRGDGGTFSDRSGSRSPAPYRRNGRSRSRSRRKGDRSRTRTHSGAKSRRRPSKGSHRTRARADSYRGRRSRSHSSRGRRSPRGHRGERHYSRRRSGDRERERERERRSDFDRDDRGGDESDDSANHDDTIGSYEGKPGDYIAARYKIIREAGLGTFGRVLECVDKQRDAIVAIKVVRKVEKYSESAKIEANILEDVNSKDADNSSLCVRMYKWFEYKGHVCLVFERLGCSLYDYLKSHDYQPFPMHCVRAVAWQLLTSLQFIHSIKLIHTDLKPENILLVDDEEERVASSSPSSSSSYSSANGRPSIESSGYRQDQTMDDADSDRLTCRPPANIATKLIDFGGATYDDESKSSIINTRQYRSPEVILGLGWSYPSDIWSAGCIIAELYIGELLFATHENLEHLALIERSIGPLPRAMIDRADSHAAKFFRHGRLDWPQGASNDESVDHIRRMRSLKQILRPEDAATGLLELLELMLVLDPENRITAKEALRHRFFDGFSMRNITNGSS